MKIVTYNVNGLRQRVSQYGSLLTLLNALDADIICFQETKLSRQDLSGDLTMAEGYEAFFSCTRTSSKGRLGYSGVATFCRVNSAFSSNEVALPLAAEEGFTGLLEHSRKKEIMKKDFCEMHVKVEGHEEITNEDKLKVDSEGRCIITDHGHFVIFNLYGPRAEDDNKERCHFKFVFFKLLQERWESLLGEGKRIFVVGDLNIAPASIDRCDAEPGFERNLFRTWLRSLLTECGGPFFDVFRSKHPERKEAYTFFSPHIGAEVFNYGSRIDHILIAGPCLHQNHDTEGHNFLDCHVEECDILAQFKRGESENTPKWNGGRSIKLKGSDHVPVYVILNSIPDLPAHNTPPIAVRYIPEVRGCQQTIVSMLTKRQVSYGVEHPGMSNILSAEDRTMKTCGECISSSQDRGTTSKHDMASCVAHFCSDHILPTPNSESQSSDPSANEHLGTAGNESGSTILRLGIEKEKAVPYCCTTEKKKARRSSSSQLTLRSFFQQPDTRTSADMDSVDTNISLTQVDTGKERGYLSHVSEGITNRNPVENVEEYNCEMDESKINPLDQDQGDTNLCLSSKRAKDNVALLEWQTIQQKMKMSLPLCKGHGEPCVARFVKKGPNIGRRFYVCARAQGPASNPEANCNYFQWASIKSKQKRR